MYLPTHFEESRTEVLQQFIREHGFGTLVTLGPDGPDANHFPFEYDPDPAPFGTLRAHIARGNPLWKTHPKDGAALAIFQGAHAYISPSWYPTKREHGKAVPTYNYMVVHAHGALRVIDDARWLRALVERLTDRNEEGRTGRWHVSDAPPDYIEQMLKAIIGIEMPIARLVGKWKLSQNQPEQNRAGVVAALHEDGSANAVAMADAVARAGSGSKPA